MTIEGGRDAHSEHSTFSSAAHRENWKDFAISSSWIRQSSNIIKELLLSGVPHHTPPVK